MSKKCKNILQTIGLVLGGLLLMPTLAQAQRTVTITIPSGGQKLKIANPSAVTVAYSVTCYDNAGTAVDSHASESLAAGNAKNYSAGAIDQGTCASGASAALNGTDALGKKYYACTGAVTYANAGNLCGSGQSFCFPRPPNACGYISAGCAELWVYKESGLEYDNTGWTAIGGNYPYVGAWSTSLSLNSGTTYWAGGTSATGTENKGAVCCENSNPASFCKVTITSTGSAAYLSSPEFKGGAPF